MEKDKIERAAGLLLIAVLGGVIGYFTLKYLLPVVIPFIFAYAVAAAVRPLTKGLGQKCPRLDKPVTAALLAILVALFLWGTYSLVSLLVSQLSGLITSLSSNLGESDNPIRRVVDFFVNLRDRLPFFSDMGLDKDGADRIYNIITGILENGAVKLSSLVTDFAADFIAALPSAVVAFFVSLSAMFYFGLDRGSFAKSVGDFFPVERMSGIVRWKRKICSAMWQYLKTYLVMMLIVFAQLFLGLTLIGIRYSFILSLIIAFVDLLPVLGVGTVLIPWSVISFISGNSKLGISIAVLFAVMSVIRQFLEPRIIGSYIGVHPVLALGAVYFGMKLFGVPGLIFAPIVLYIARSVISEKKEESVKQ